MATESTPLIEQPSARNPYEAYGDALGELVEDHADGLVRDYAEATYANPDAPHELNTATVRALRTELDQGPQTPELDADIVFADRQVGRATRDMRGLQARLDSGIFPDAEQAKMRKRIEDLRSERDEWSAVRLEDKSSRTAEQRREREESGQAFRDLVHAEALGTTQERFSDSLAFYGGESSAPRSSSGGSDAPGAASSGSASRAAEQTAAPSAEEQPRVPGGETGDDDNRGGTPEDVSPRASRAPNRDPRYQPRPIVFGGPAPTTPPSAGTPEAPPQLPRRMPGAAADPRARAQTGTEEPLGGDGYTPPPVEEEPDWLPPDWGPPPAYRGEARTYPGDDGRGGAPTPPRPPRPPLPPESPRGPLPRPRILSPLDQRIESWKGYRDTYAPEMTDREIRQRAERDVRRAERDDRRHQLVLRLGGAARRGALSAAVQAGLIEEQPRVGEREAAVKSSRSDQFILRSLGRAASVLGVGGSATGMAGREIAAGFTGRPASLEFDQTRPSPAYRFGEFAALNLARLDSRGRASRRNGRDRPPATITDVKNIARRNLGSSRRGK